MCEEAHFSEIKSPSDLNLGPNRTISSQSLVNLRLVVTMVVSELQNNTTSRRQKPEKSSPQWFRTLQQWCSRSGGAPPPPYGSAVALPDGAEMADEYAAELERVLDELKRQLPERHALAAIIADEELDFEQVTELTLDDLREMCVGFVYRFDYAACLLLLRMGPSSVDVPPRSLPLVARSQINNNAFCFSVPNLPARRRHGQVQSALQDGPT